MDKQSLDSSWNWNWLEQVFTWFLVILGWAIVSELQDFREVRKDRLAKLSDLRQQLADLEDVVLDFHTEDFDGRKVQQIQSNLSAIARELTFLENCHYLEGNHWDQLIDFRQACTGKNFDRSSHAKLGHDDAICSNIIASRANLDAAIIQFQISAATKKLTPLDILQAIARDFWKSIRGFVNICAAKIRSHATRSDDNDAW